MTAPFDEAFARASRVMRQQFADEISVDGVSGKGIVTPDPEIVIGGGVQIINGAHLHVMASDFPSIAVNAAVIHQGVQYAVMQPDRSTDASGWLHCVMVKR